MANPVPLEKCPFCGQKTDSDAIVCPNPECQIRLTPRMLVDWEIERLLDEDALIVDPILQLKGKERSGDAQLGPGSLDLRLDSIFKEFKAMNQEFIDLRKTQGREELSEEELYRLVELDISKDEAYILHPGEFVLANSLEYIVMPDYLSGRLDGRSSYGRYGVTIHSTAGGVDAGFQGHIVFELSNYGKVPVKLHPMDRVARISFFFCQRCRDPYRGKFQLQIKVKPPKQE
jgi:dCTP deaminase